MYHYGYVKVVSRILQVFPAIAVASGKPERNCLNWLSPIEPRSKRNACRPVAWGRVLECCVDFFRFACFLLLLLLWGCKNERILPLLQSLVVDFLVIFFWHKFQHRCSTKTFMSRKIGPGRKSLMMIERQPKNTLDMYRS